MNKNIFKVLTALMLMVASVAHAQMAEYGFDDKDPFSPHSVRPVRKADVMYNTTVWIRLDMREKMNEPLFAAGNEISKLIIDAVKAGVLRPYKNDSLINRMTIQEFNDNLKIPGAEEDLGGDDPFGGGDWGGGGWGGGDDAWGGGGAGLADAGPDEFFPKDIYLLRIKEHRQFNRKTGRWGYDIQSITLLIPADLNPKGTEAELATFSYKELVTNVFQDNPNAIWFNPKNTAENKNLADAFALRQFASTLVKFVNPRDRYVEDIYQGNMKLSLAKAQEYEHRLVQYESELWSN